MGRLQQAEEAETYMTEELKSLEEKLEKVKKQNALQENDMTLLKNENAKMNKLKDQMEKVELEKEQMKKDLQQVKNENYVYKANNKEL